MNIRWLMSMLLVASLVLSACGAEDITAEGIVEKMREAQATTTDMHAVVQIDFTSPDESGSMKGEYWMRKTGEVDAEGVDVTAYRGKVLEASEADAVGTELVFNGKNGWFYVPSENQVIVGTIDDLDAMPERERQSAGPVDQMDMLMELQDVVQQGLDAVDIEILGEETIAGRNAYKLKITPKQETQAELQLPIELLLETTLWVDSERWMPLKLLVDANEMGRIEVTAEQLDINTGLDQALFEATYPAGAEVVQLADVIAEMEQMEEETGVTNLEEAQAKVDFTLLSATETPNGTALVDVQVITLPTGAAVSQTYAGTGSEWTLLQSKGESFGSEAGGGTEVEVRGTTGTIIESRSSVGTILSWTEGEVTYVIAGTLSAEEALEIANSLK